MGGQPETSEAADAHTAEKKPADATETSAAPPSARRESNARRDSKVAEDSLLPSPSGPSKLKSAMERVMQKLKGERALEEQQAKRDAEANGELSAADRRSQRILLTAVSQFVKAGQQHAIHGKSTQPQQEDYVVPTRVETRSVPSQYVETPGYWTDEMAVYPHFSRRMRLHVTGTARCDTYYSPADSHTRYVDRNLEAVRKALRDRASPRQRPATATPSSFR